MSADPVPSGGVDSGGGTGTEFGTGIGIGVDIGGTSTKAAVVDALGNVVASIVLPTQGGAKGIVATAVQATLQVAKSASVAIRDLSAIGIGVPGIVDPQQGTVRFAGNVGIGRDAIDLASRLSTELGVDVHIENDVRAAALGAEWYLTATSGPVNDLAYLSIGTGIAAGFVEHGQLRRGNSLVAGEIGHIPIDPQGPLCACGQVGCIEAISSGSAIERMWPTETGTSAAALHRAAAAGDTAARRLWAGVVSGLSRAVQLLALTWDPEVIVLSGGVASLGDVLRDAIAEQLATDAQQSEFLGVLDLSARIGIIDPSVPLGPIGAVRAAYAARPALQP